MSSVPELPLDSNLRPSNSLDTCWGHLPDVGVGGLVPEGYLPCTNSLLFEQQIYYICARVCGMYMQMGWRAAPAASMQGLVLRERASVHECRVGMWWVCRLTCEGAGTGVGAHGGGRANGDDMSAARRTEVAAVSSSSGETRVMALRTSETTS